MANTTVLTIDQTNRAVILKKNESTDYPILLLPSEHIKYVSKGGVSTDFKTVVFSLSDGTERSLDLGECTDTNYNGNTAGDLDNFFTDLKVLWKSPAYSDAERVVAKSADYTVSTSDRIIEVTTGAADKTMTLPAAANMTGISLTFVKVDNGAGKVVLDGNGAETINGSATNNEIDTQYDSLTIYSNGTTWYIRVKRLA